MWPRHGLTIPNQQWRMLQPIKREGRLYRRRLKWVTENRRDIDRIVDKFLGQYTIPDREKLEIMAPELNRSPRIATKYHHLFTLGRSMLSIQCQHYVMASGSRSQTKVGGLDFDVVAGEKLPSLDSKHLLTRFVQESSLDRVVLVRQPENRAAFAIDSLCMLLGSIHSHHGSPVVSHFINTRVIEGSDGLFQLSLRLSDE